MDQAWTWAARIGSVLTDPFLDPASRTWLGGLAVAAVVAVVVGSWSARQSPLRTVQRGLRALARAITHRSARLDVQLLIARQLLAGLGLAIPSVALSLWLATSSVRSLDDLVGDPQSLGLPVGAVPWWALMLGYTLALFVVQDLSRFLLHYLMHRVPALWALHQVHHSAEVLTPLTFHRLHPLESALYGLRGILANALVVVPAFWLFRDAAVVWTILGVHAVGLGFNVVSGNLRHSELWWSFGPWVERWLISPAQHQLHHSRDLGEQGSNLGTWLAIWDRLAGTLQLADEGPPPAFGLHEDERNHRDDLLSALTGPVIDAARQLPLRSAAVLGLVVAGLFPADALADPSEAEPVSSDADDEDAPEDEDPLEVLVETEGGMPRIAGSAQVIPEEDLERFEMDDVGRVLVGAPGVYVRGEDGLGLRPNIGLRGATSERSSKITLLEDGIPFAPAPYAAPAAYYFPLTTRMTGIEVIKGPAAIQNGPNTVGGAVNLRSRGVPTDGLRAGADLAVGSYASGKAHLWAGGGDNRGGWLVEGVHLGTQGFWEADHGGPVGTQRSELMAKGRVVLRDSAEQRDTLELKTGLSREDSRSTYLGIHPDDYADNPLRRYAVTSEARMRWWRHAASLSYTHRRGDKLQLRITAYRHQLHRSWRKFNAFAGGPNAFDVLTGPDSGANAPWLALLRGEADSLTDDEALMIGTNERRFVATGVSGVARFVARDPGEGKGPSIRGEVGLRVHHDEVLRRHTEDAYFVREGALEAVGTDTITTRDDLSYATAIAAHTAWDVGLGAFHLEPGLRTEVIETRQKGTNTPGQEPTWRVHPLPGLGLRVQPSDGFAVFTGLYRGFSPVAPGQDASTRPESAWNAELGMRIADGSAQAEITGFVSDYSNLTGQCTFSSGCTDDQVGDQFNAGRVRVGGVELAARHTIDLGRGWSLPAGGAFTWTHSAFLADFQSNFPLFGSVQRGDALPYVPPVQASGRLGVAHHRWNLDGTFEGVSGQRDTAGPVRESGIEGRVLVHASTSLRVHDEFRIYATVQNALGSAAIASLRPLGPRPVGPRTVMVGIKAAR